MGDAVLAVLGALVWFVTQIALSFWHVAQAVARPDLWLDWSNAESLARFIHYGASLELFFVVLTALLCLGFAGAVHRPLLWGALRGMEGMANGVGRVVAWAGLLMVVQQILIVFGQRVFAAPTMGFGLGQMLELDMSWWSEELKLYNAAIVALCCAWTFVQRGHVRVDLLYGRASFAARRVVEMAGAVLFMAPVAVLVWFYGWFFMWRHLVTPKVSASDGLEMILRKASVLRWNVETTGFTPAGFNAHFLFKVLLVAFAAMVFVQAVACALRAALELIEGPEAADRHLDRDVGQTE